MNQDPQKGLCERPEPIDSSPDQRPTMDKCNKCGCTDFEQKDIYGPMVKSRTFKVCEACGTIKNEIKDNQCH